MKAGDINIKRFVRALHSALEGLAGDAHCFGYRNDPSYLELKEDLQYTLRMVKQGEEFAGRLLYKNIQNISPNTALKIAARAKTEYERLFYIAVAEMNETRIQQTDPNFRKRISILDEEEPVLRWSYEDWGAHVCPHCGFGNKRDEYIGEPYRHCPACGKRLKKPIMKVLRRNAIRCNICGDEIESRTTHEYRTCSCGACAVDGGLDYTKRVGNRANFTDISEYDAVDPEEK